MGVVRAVFALGVPKVGCPFRLKRLLCGPLAVIFETNLCIQRCACDTADNYVLEYQNRKSVAEFDFELFAFKVVDFRENRAFAFSAFLDFRTAKSVIDTNVWSRPRTDNVAVCMKPLTNLI